MHLRVPALCLDDKKRTVIRPDGFLERARSIRPGLPLNDKSLPLELHGDALSRNLPVLAARNDGRQRIAVRPVGMGEGLQPREARALRSASRLIEIERGAAIRTVMARTMTKPAKTSTSTLSMSVKPLSTGCGSRHEFSIFIPALP